MKIIAKRDTTCLGRNKIVHLVLFNLWLCTILTFYSYGSLAQSIRKIDEVNLRANSFRNVQSDSVFSLANKALELSIESDYIEGKINAYTNLCFACYFKSDYDNAVQNCTNALALYQSSPFKPDDITTAYQFLGLTHINQGKYDEAIGAFSELVKIATQQHNNFVLADASSNLGLSYLNKRDYSKAREYYLKALKIHDNINYPDGKVYVYQNIGRIYFDQGDFSNARSFLNTAAQLAKEIDNHRALFYVYSLLGQVSEPNEPQSETILLDAIRIADSLDLNYEKSEVTLLLAELYFKRKQYDRVEKYAESAIQGAQERSTSDLLLKIYNLLIRAYTIDGKFNKAGLYTEKYEHVSDSISEKNSETLLSSLLNISEMAANDQNYMFAKQRLLEAQNHRIQRYVIIATVSIIFILIIVVFFIIKKTNRDIASLNAQINTLKNEQESYFRIIQNINSDLTKAQNELMTNDLDISEEDSLQFDSINNSVKSAINHTNMVLNIN